MSVRLSHIETGHSGLMSAPELGDETLAVAAPPPAAAGPLGAAAGASMLPVYSDHHGAPLAVPRWIPLARAAGPRGKAIRLDTPQQFEARFDELSREMSLEREMNLSRAAAGQGSSSAAGEAAAPAAAAAAAPAADDPIAHAAGPRGTMARAGLTARDLAEPRMPPDATAAEVAAEVAHVEALLDSADTLHDVIARIRPIGVTVRTDHIARYRTLSPISDTESDDESESADVSRPMVGGVEGPSSRPIVVGAAVGAATQTEVPSWRLVVPPTVAVVAGVEAGVEERDPQHQHHH